VNGDGPRATANSRLSRRQLFKRSGVATAGAVAASMASPVIERAAASTGPTRTGSGGSAGSSTVPFHGAHQAGIVTPEQASLVLATYDVTARGRTALRSLLRTWSDGAAELCAGRMLPGPTSPDLPATDTGEAQGLGPARLTVTLGLGPGVFDDRFGLAARRPAALDELPPFPGDELDAGQSGGDLCLQACADDPQVAFHAVHDLTRLATGSAELRLLMLGFARSSSSGTEVPTPRNLLGFHDGTDNLNVDVARALDDHVWVGRGADQLWMRGGTYMVVRRIRTLVDAWDDTSLQDQEAAIGRHKTSGAPLGGTRQYGKVDLGAVDAGGQPVIPTSAHIRQASPAYNSGSQILRRAYSYAEGRDPVTGEIDAGLIFVCFQQDPRTGFTRIQQRLAQHDALTAQYLVHTASGVFACPPGVAAGGHWCDALFESAPTSAGAPLS
jgi:deferrochelatase/peroxidase EfeB